MKPSLNRLEDPWFSQVKNTTNVNLFFMVLSHIEWVRQFEDNESLGPIPGLTRLFLIIIALVTGRLVGYTHLK
jgi:hypothetical protein